MVFRSISDRLIPPEVAIAVLKSATFFTVKVSEVIFAAIAFGLRPVSLRIFSIKLFGRSSRPGSIFFQSPFAPDVPSVILFVTS